MAAYLSSSSSSSSSKMKRKDLGDVSDDFSDFSLASPACKIRRLDPITEEEVVMRPVFDQLVPEGQVPVEDMVSAPPANEERAIVLYRPVSSPIVQSPSCFSVTLDSDILSSFKKQFMGQSEAEDIEARINDKNNGASAHCMSVVPWVPSQFTPTLTSDGSQTENVELMDAEETGAATMDIEEDNDSVVQGQQPLAFGGGLIGSEGTQQWQQQHCMTPQLPPNTSTPIVWYQ